MYGYMTEDQGKTWSPWGHIWISILTGIGLGIGATLVGLLFYMLGVRIPKR